MQIFKTNTLFFVGYFLVLFLLPTVIFSQKNSEPGLIGQLEKISLKIEQDMEDSNKSITQENYYKAQKLTDKALNGLNLLIDVFMPLPERIKMLLRNEKGILDKTHHFANQVRNKTEIRKEASTDLSQLQINNRDLTGKSIEILKRQLDSLASRPQTTQPNHNDSESQNETIKQVERLLFDSRNFQNNVISFLDKSKLDKAIQEEEKAINKLEEALDKLRQNDKKNPQSQANQQHAQKQDQTGKDQSASKQDPSKQKDKSTASNPDRMTPQAALKELSRLQKKAEDEKRRRKRQYGEVKIPHRFATEKDW